MSDKANLHIYEDVTALTRAVAAHWIAAARESIEMHGGFHVALAGGSTPGALYRLLATDELRHTPEWGATHIYFGDERCVPPDHPDSNYLMADEAMLRHVDVPREQVHRIRAEQRDRETAARDYEQILTTHLPVSPDGGPPRFDLVLLGLGPDGHIASLFPDTAILAERTRLAAPVYVDKLGAWRVSLTYPAIDNARQIVIMVTGEGKADIVGEVVGGQGEARYPAQQLTPRGRLDWFLDRAAAGRLT